MFYCREWDSKRFLSHAGLSLLGITLCLHAAATEGEAPPAFQVGSPTTIASPGGSPIAARNRDGTWHVGYFSGGVFHTSRSTDPQGPWQNVATMTRTGNYWWNPQIISLSGERWYQEITEFDAFDCGSEGEYGKDNGELTPFDPKCEWTGDNIGTTGYSKDDGLTWRIRNYSGFSRFSSDDQDIDEIFLQNFKDQVLGMVDYPWNRSLYVATYNEAQHQWETFASVDLEALNALGYLRAAGSFSSLFAVVADSEPSSNEYPRLNLHYVETRDNGLNWTSHSIIGPDTYLGAPTSYWELKNLHVKIASHLHRRCIIFPGRLPGESRYTFFVTNSFGENDFWLEPHPITSDAISWIEVAYFDWNGIVILWREYARDIPDTPIHYILSYDNGQSWTDPRQLDDSFNRYSVSTPTLFFDNPLAGHMVYAHKNCEDCFQEVVIAPITIDPGPDPVVVTDAEAARALLENFRASDSNDDGVLSMSDTIDFLSNVYPLHLSPDFLAGNLYGRMDSNNDGVISVAEVRWFSEGRGAIHAADLEARNVISLSHLLRVIQFFNAGEYHCGVAPGYTEDGYELGPGAQACPPHSSDYQPQDWRISLSELLRLIQFYNRDGYHPCEDGEDGFCPGSE